MTPDRPLNDAALLAALDWYRAAGVDLAVGDAPVDRFAASVVAPPRPRLVAQPDAPAPAVVLNAEPSETRALAAAATTLEALREAMNAYEGCALKRRATQLVFADGNPEAEIMLVGEGPGEQEDLAGKPFVGRAGQLLDRMLGAIGLDRTQVYIANMVPWRPPGNRDPSPEELALCAPFLHRQIELVRPRLLMTLGRVASQSLFATSQSISRMRGKWQDLTIGTHSMKAMPTLHPAYLLRTPSAKEQAWRDMLELKRAIGGEKSGPG